MSNINLSDLPISDGIPKGLGFCKTDSGSLLFDSGNNLSSGVQNYDSLSQRPSASDFGKGIARVGKYQYVSDGISWTLNGGFTPSIYSGAKTATTDVTNQAELFATGATWFEASHINTTYDLIIGLGNTLAEAKAACSTGIANENKFLLLKTGLAGVPVTLSQSTKGYAAHAWLGVGGTVDWLSTQGV